MKVGTAFANAVIGGTAAAPRKENDSSFGGILSSVADEVDGRPADALAAKPTSTDGETLDMKTSDATAALFDPNAKAKKSSDDQKPSTDDPGSAATLNTSLLALVQIAAVAPTPTTGDAGASVSKRTDGLSEPSTRLSNVDPSTLLVKARPAAMVSDIVLQSHLAPQAAAKVRPASFPDDAIAAHPATETGKVEASPAGTGSFRVDPTSRAVSLTTDVSSDASSSAPASQARGFVGDAMSMPTSAKDSALPDTDTGTDASSRVSLVPSGETGSRSAQAESIGVNAARDPDVAIVAIVGNGPLDTVVARRQTEVPAPAFAAANAVPSGAAQSTTSGAAVASTATLPGAPDTSFTVSAESSPAGTGSFPVDPMSRAMTPSMVSSGTPSGAPPSQMRRLVAGAVSTPTSAKDSVLLDPGADASSRGAPVPSGEAGSRSAQAESTGVVAPRDPDAEMSSPPQVAIVATVGTGPVDTSFVTRQQTEISGPALAVANAVTSLAAQPTTPGTAVAPARTMLLQLNPGDLGTISVRLHLTGRTLDVSLTASDAGTASLLDHDRAALTSALGDRDYQLNSLVIQGGDAASTPGGSSASSDSSGNRSASQSAADQQGGGTGRGGSRDPSPRQNGSDRGPAPATVVARGDAVFV